MKLKLSEWASIAEIIGAVAIVVSLIFVGLEIRESGLQTELNTQAVQGSALQQHFDQHTSLLMDMLHNPNLYAVLVKGDEVGLDGLTSQENAQFQIYTISNLRNHSVAHALMESGILPQAQGQTFSAALERAIQRSRGMRELWRLRRSEFSEGFRQEVDAFVADAE